MYEQASGQQLNREKTSLYFSRNTPQDVQDDIKNRFGAEIIKEHEKYLGLPSLGGKNKRNTSCQLIEWLNNKLLGWKEKLLSNAGKEILIKTVAQAIPMYTMSVFKLPDVICDEMTSLVCNFSWGQSNEKNKMAWLSWDKMCTPKDEGGMFFEISKLSILCYWQSKVGGYRHVQIH